MMIDVERTNGMDVEKAIAILERKTTIPGDGYTWEEIEHAIAMAVLSLKNQVGEEPLTLEQIKNMVGYPVLVKEKGRCAFLGWGIVSEFEDVELPGNDSFGFKFSDYNNTWVAYTYENFHLIGCTGCEYLDEENAPCAHCMRSNRLIDYYKPMGNI